MQECRLVAVQGQPLVVLVPAPAQVAAVERAPAQVAVQRAVARAAALVGKVVLVPSH